jgi:hypothetical protein
LEPGDLAPAASHGTKNTPKTISKSADIAGSIFAEIGRVGAVKKAIELMSNGMHDVHIIDSKTGRTYRREEFHLLVGGK